MSGVVAFIRRCLAAGMDYETALLAAEQFEASPPTPTPGALRQRRYKARHQTSSVTPSDDNDVSDAGDERVLGKEKSPEPPKENSTPKPPPSPPMGAHGSKIVRLEKPNGFERFWEAYPRKVGKGAARPKWDKALHKADPAEIMAALERAKHDWSELESQFIPHPATWLSQERWLDEPVTRATGPPVARVDPDFLARQLARLNPQ